MDPVKMNKVAGLRPVSEPEIHATAVVDPGARLGHNVKVGPYAIIGPDVVIGPDCVIGSSVLLTGHVIIGSGNRIFHGAAIGCEPQDKKYRGEVSYVEIGDNNDIREYCTIHPATGEGASTCVGSDNLLMAYVHIAHNCRVHDRTVLANAVNLAGHVEIESHAIVGGMTPVHQFVRVGAFAFVGGGSRLPQDVPPFIKVAGNPDRGRRDQRHRAQARRLLRRGSAEPQEGLSAALPFRAERHAGARAHRRRLPADASTSRT